MNLNELRKHVAELPEAVRVKIKESDLTNKSIVSYSDLRYELGEKQTIKQLKSLLSKFNDEDIIEIKATTEYYDDDEHGTSLLDAVVTINRLETDDEMTQRVMQKIKKNQKNKFNN